MQQFDENQTQLVITLFYLLFSACLVYPPTEFVAAGFTIAQLFEKYLGSENINFVEYHIYRILLTVLIHSSLPLGYVFVLTVCGIRGEWSLFAAGSMACIPLITIYKLLTWTENNRVKHPVARALTPYATTGSDWRLVAASLNSEFRSVDKISIPLSATTKFIATESWLIKVTQYSINAVKQADCTLVATAVDTPNLTTSEDEEVQYLNIKAIPTRNDVQQFTFRISTTALRELQPRLVHPVRVPEHISLMPTLIERFVTVFQQYVNQNPVYYIDEEVEPCIGCMQAPADVKLNKRCAAPPAPAANNNPVCQQCNCRVLWCSACMGRWWAALARGPRESWLAGRGTCPVCRAPFCLLDVCPARPPPA